MGLWVKKNIGHSDWLAIWRVEEEEAFFLQQLDLQENESLELANLKGARRLEWLASRWLVHELLTGLGHEDRYPVQKDEFGKPYLLGGPFQLSFSHSHGYVAVLLSDQPVGVDLQAIVPKIDRIAKKFMREEELASLQPETRLEHLHFYWSAKEALYKAHGRRELDFRQHIFVQPFDYQPFSNTVGRVSKGTETLSFDLYFEKMDGFVLAYALPTAIAQHAPLGPA